MMEVWAARSRTGEREQDSESQSARLAIGPLEKARDGLPRGQSMSDERYDGVQAKSHSGAAAGEAD